MLKVTQIYYLIYSYCIKVAWKDGLFGYIFMSFLLHKAFQGFVAASFHVHEYHAKKMNKRNLATPISTVTDGIACADALSKIQAHCKRKDIQFDQVIDGNMAKMEMLVLKKKKKKKNPLQPFGSLQSPA